MELKTIKKTSFNEWFKLFLEEKEIDLDHDYDYEENGIWHYIPLSVIIEFIKNLPEQYQEVIKEELIILDFMNGNLYHFFEYIGKGMVEEWHYNE